MFFFCYQVNMLYLSVAPVSWSSSNEWYRSFCTTYVTSKNSQRNNMFGTPEMSLTPLMWRNVMSTPRTLDHGFECSSLHRVSEPSLCGIWSTSSSSLPLRAFFGLRWSTSRNFHYEFPESSVKNSSEVSHGWRPLIRKTMGVRARVTSSLFCTEGASIAMKRKDKVQLGVSKLERKVFLHAPMGKQSDIRKSNEELRNDCYLHLCSLYVGSTVNVTAITWAE